MNLISVPTLAGLVFVATATGSCARATSQVDAVPLSPRYYTVLLDSNRVRVLDYRLPAGQKEPMHSHPAYVVHFFQPAKLRATYPDGHSSESVVTAGQTVYRGALTHALENIGDSEVHALLVELEPSSR